MRTTNADPYHVAVELLCWISPEKNGKYEKEEAFYIFQTANKFRSLAIRKQTSLNPNSGRIFDSTEGFNRIALEIFHFKLLFSLWNGYNKKMIYALIRYFWLVLLTAEW